ncbi:MAG: type 4a pilus biogenesis protein PilO [Candidatus Schekmanbacteria bacterium]|nr:type 4a pilus biogenesis protein PilO [Candidatus Schekmanbacteria bacterium]
MEKQKGFLPYIIGLTAFIAISLAGIYIKLYRPMIQYILSARGQMEEIKKALADIALSEQSPVSAAKGEERKIEGTKEQFCQRFPPPETLPKYMTFQGSGNLFYGEGTSLQQDVPAVFKDLANAFLQSGGNQLNLLNATEEEAKLKLPGSDDGGKARELKEYKLMLSFTGEFRQVADFLGLIQKMPRFTKISNITLKADKSGLKTSIILKTYHFPQDGA